MNVYVSVLGGGALFTFFKERCVNWQNGLRHILDTLMQCGYIQIQHHKAHFTRLHLADAPKRVLLVSISFFVQDLHLQTACRQKMNTVGEYSNLEMPRHLNHHRQDSHFKRITTDICIAATVL